MQIARQRRESLLAIVARHLRNRLLSEYPAYDPPHRPRQMVARLQTNGSSVTCRSYHGLTDIVVKL